MSPLQAAESERIFRLRRVIVHSIVATKGSGAVHTIVRAMRKQGMNFPKPIMEMSRVHGWPLWYTINPVPDVHFSDAVTGRYIHRTRHKGMRQ